VATELEHRGWIGQEVQTGNEERRQVTGKISDRFLMGFSRVAIEKGRAKKLGLMVDTPTLWEAVSLQQNGTLLVRF